MKKDFSERQLFEVTQAVPLSIWEWQAANFCLINFERVKTEQEVTGYSCYNESGSLVEVPQYYM